MNASWMFADRMDEVACAIPWCSAPLLILSNQSFLMPISWTPSSCVVSNDRELILIRFLNNFISGLELDRITRDSALPTVVPNHMDVDDLRHLNGAFFYNEKLMNFAVFDIDYGRTLGNELSNLLNNSVYDKMLLVMNDRWFGIQKLCGMYKLYNCHPTNIDGTEDSSLKQPAAIFRTHDAGEAATILKEFGCATFKPTEIFVLHGVICHEWRKPTFIFFPWNSFLWQMTIKISK